MLTASEGLARTQATLESRESRAILLPEHWAIALLIGVSLLLALLLDVLPYVTLHPYFPFERDMQHAINTAYILAHGQPFPAPDYIRRVYPDSFSYLAATIAALTGWSPLVTLKVLPTLSLFIAALALYTTARHLFGARIAALTIFVYGVTTYEPRDTYFAGTFIDLVANTTLISLYLLSLAQTIKTCRLHWAIVTGLLFGFIFQYHYISTTSAIGSTIIILVGLSVINRSLFSMFLVSRLLFTAALAFFTSLPYGLYYAQAYAQIIFARLGLLRSSAYIATFPGILFPNDVWFRMGPHYFLFLPIGIIYLIILIFNRKYQVLSPSIIFGWTILLLIGTFTSLLIDSLRFLYILVLPGAIIIALYLDALCKRPEWRDFSHFGVRYFLSRASLLLFAFLLAAGGVLYVALRSKSVAQINMFGENQEVPALTALGAAWSADGQPYVLTDETGFWASYYAQGKAFVIPGGPPAFAFYGQHERTQYEELWPAFQEPCSWDSLQTLRRYNVGLVYIGPVPRHWYWPGFVYTGGVGFSGCSWYSLVYERASSGGPIAVYRVDPQVASFR